MGIFRGMGIIAVCALSACTCLTTVDECKPISCEDQGKNCGAVSDQCHSVLDCGTCASGMACGASVPNVCGQNVCVPTGCARVGAECGKIGDGCGGVLDCGTCSGTKLCGAPGAPNRCVLPNGCIPATCSSLGAACGKADDGCGDQVDCGACANSAQVCGALNRCISPQGCVPTTCTKAGATCGALSDGCGHVLACGTCSAPASCGGSGVANTCGCQAKTCAALGKNCGTLPDGCGMMLTCGGCTTPDSCGGGGLANVCGCQPTTCAAEGKNCGMISNGCGGTISCGSCPPTGMCGSNNVCVCPGVECDPAPILTATAGVSWVELKWTDPSSAETSFEVERSLNGTAFSALITAAANQISHTDPSVAPTTGYWYRVRATAATGPGAWSNVVQVTTLAPAPSVWQTIGADNQHTGFNPTEQGKPPLTLAWTASGLGTGPMQPAAIEGGKAFVTSVGYFANQTLWALNTTTGATAWSYNFGMVHSIGQAAVYSGKVFVAHSSNYNDTKLWSLNAASGTVIYSVAMESQWEHYWAPVMANNKVFLNGGTYGGLYGFNATTGARNFFQGLEQYDDWSPALDASGNIYSFIAGKFRQHEPSAGAENWSVSVSWHWNGYSMNTAPVVGGGLVYIIAPPDLHAIDPATHAIKWSAAGFNFTGMPAYRAGSVYAINAGNVRVHDAVTGTYQWTFVGDGALSFPPVLANGYLYASSPNNVYAVDLTTHAQVWTAATGGWLSIGEGKLIVAGANATVWGYALTP